MLQYGRLLSFPLTFKNLEKKVKLVRLDNIVAQFSQDYQVFNVVAIANGKYTPKIQIFSPELSTSSLTRISCDCEFFKYSLAYSLYKNDALIDPENFVLRQPRKKNTSGSLGGCKHIILLAQQLWTNKNIFVIPNGV